MATPRRSRAPANGPLSAPDVGARVAAEGERLPRVLARALATVLVASTQSARRDLNNAAEALVYPRRWPEAASPADIIARAACQARRAPERQAEVPSLPPKAMLERVYALDSHDVGRRIKLHAGGGDLVHHSHNGADADAGALQRP